ncbi:MAG: alpha-L-fucosidase [Planctomycetaceae bacterium]|jgi:hypothetical protein|nr:alpha-L-fucosidase [Planctomycetaceae bacterium]
MKLFNRFIVSVLFLFLLFPVTVFSREPQPERTDWFLKHGYGVLVHYLNKIQNTPKQIASLGKSTSWDDCVNEFNVELFAERMKETGAGYVIFTVLQQERFMIAPNETFNRLTGYKTGEACSSRDLIEDLYQALHQRNIDLMLYFTGDATTLDPQAAKGLKLQLFPVTEEFVRNWSNVVAEYGNRYKDKVKGYWVDGCWIGYNDKMFKIFAEGLRAGNPDRIIAFNPGIQAKNTPIIAYSVYEDYTCGEQLSFSLLPTTGRFLNGEQWHILSFLGMSSYSADWGAWAQPGTCKNTLELAEYIHHVNALGGVVSIDVLLYRDGELDRSQLETLKPLREKINTLAKDRYAWKEGKAIPAKNIAWKKPAFLRSNNNKRELMPSTNITHAARSGNDGNRNTTAVGAFEWAWTYETDLLEPIKIQRIVVHFGSGYPTEVELFSVAPTGNEISLGRFNEQKGQSLDVSFDPKEVRQIRVRSYKPNGPNQPGRQMSIAELEVYE